MRKKLLVLIGILLTLVTLPMIKPALAATAQYSWAPPYAWISLPNVAYDDGSTVELSVSVWNNVNGWGYNVSKVVLNFTYLGVYKMVDVSASPEKIALGSAKTYTISFTADAAEFPFRSSGHYYQIMIENVNSTTTPRKTLTPLTVVTGYFSVYSAEYNDANELQDEFYDSYYWEFPYWEFASTEARFLGFEAALQANRGDNALSRADFAAAKTYYEAAIDLYKQALEAEKDKEQTDEAASLNTTLTRNAANMLNANANMTWAEADMTRANGEAEAAVIAANGTRLQGEAALMNANGFFAIGIGFAIGWSLIGVGVIIYAFKRPKPPT
jgi:hypothetical protein